MLSLKETIKNEGLFLRALINSKLQVLFYLPELKSKDELGG